MRRRRKACKDKRWARVRVAPASTGVSPRRPCARMAHVRVAPAQGWRRFDSGRAGHRRGGTGLGRGFECQLSATDAARAEHGKARMIAPAPRAHHAEVAGAGPTQKFKEQEKPHTAAAAHLLWEVRAQRAIRVSSRAYFRRAYHRWARLRRSDRLLVDQRQNGSSSRCWRHFRAPCVRAPARGRTAIEKRTS